MLKQSSYRNGRATRIQHASMRRQVGLPFHCGTAPEETPTPCVTQSRRERMLVMRLKIAGDLRWNGRPISHAECDRSSQDGPRQRPSAAHTQQPEVATASPKARATPNNGRPATPSPQTHQPEAGCRSARTVGCVRGEFRSECKKRAKSARSAPLARVFVAFGTRTCLSPEHSPQARGKPTT